MKITDSEIKQFIAISFKKINKTYFLNIDKELKLILYKEYVRGFYAGMEDAKRRN